MPKLIYKNGREEAPGDFLRAKEVLIAKGLLGTLGNWGPHTARKDERIQSVVETFTEGGFLFTIVEYEVMTLGMDFRSVSAPHRERAAWYMPV
jgi:hypothetical protein